MDLNEILLRLGGVRLRLAAWLIRQERRHLERSIPMGWDAKLSYDLDGLTLAVETLHGILGSQKGNHDAEQS